MFQTTTMVAFQTSMKMKMTILICYCYLYLSRRVKVWYSGGMGKGIPID